MAMDLVGSVTAAKPLFESSLCHGLLESRRWSSHRSISTPAPSLSGLKGRSSSSQLRTSSTPATAPRPHRHLHSQLLLHNVVSVCTSSVVRASSESGATESRPSIGYLGLGIMGFAMARNLIKAGYNVTVWNRTASKCDPLVQEGAKYAPTPGEVTAACDITFASLADPDTAISVATGENGAINGLGPSKGYVDISTVDGDTAKFIAEKVKATGALYVEAPVSGSKKPAEDGQLIFLAAGTVLELPLP